MSSFVPSGKVLRVALLGCGMMGREHASYIQAFEQTRVCFICDSDESMRQEMLAQLLASPASGGKGVVTHAPPMALRNEEELLEHAEGIDILVIATPNYLHTPTLLRWAQFNLTILVEKPAAVSIEQIRQLEAMKASTDFVARVWVAMEYRYIPAISRLISLLPEIGQPKMVTIRENRYPFLQKVGNWNRDRECTGDSLVEKCCHFFDLFRHILKKDYHEDGGIKSFAQRGINYHKEESFQRFQTPIIDSAYVLMSFKDAEVVGSETVGTSRQSESVSIKDDTIGCLELCMFAEGSRHQEEVIVTGTLGRLEAYLPENKVFHFQRPQDEHWTNRTEPPPKSASSSTVYDCTDVKDVHGISMDEFPTHTGYHYASTAVEWYKLLRAIDEFERTGIWNPEVSLQDGMEAVKMGLAATENLGWHKDE